tara:strand:+ start:871 stop:1467 length:597 start_codon:yes stop_codon:yes gene_type:complete
MYLNFKLLHSRELTPSDFSFLLAVKGNKIEDNSATLEHYFKDTLVKFEETNLITFVKAKNKSQTKYNTVRLTSLGNEWVDDLTTPNISEGDVKMRDYLCKMYLDNADTERVIGNKKLISMYISILRTHLGLDLHEFYYLCDYFLSVHTFTKKLENIFMDRNKNRYGNFKSNIEDSSLHQFWEQYEQEIREYFKQKIKQ